MPTPRPGRPYPIPNRDASQLPEERRIGMPLTTCKLRPPAVLNNPPETKLKTSELNRGGRGPLD